MKDNPEVLALLKSYPSGVRTALLGLRQLIVETAAGDTSIGTLQETLKWGQPSYLTVRPRTGTTIRIDRDHSADGGIALYVNCRTSLVSEWRGLFPQLTFGGDRSVHLRLDVPLPEDALRQMITMALTYHLKRH
ncbi:MAG: DUF1801 domain-containing protein [Roseibium sp.]